MSYRIQKDLSHIERSLGIETVGADNESPSMVLDSIQTVIEATGWPVPSELGSASLTSAANVQSVSTPVVPEGESHYVYVAHTFHSDAGSTHNMRIDIEDPQSGLTVGITNGITAAVNTVIALPRPVLLVSGQNLRTSSVTLVGVGNTITLTLLFVRLKPGEYLPGTPYG